MTGIDMGASRTTTLHGRDTEIADIDRLLNRVRDGGSGTRILRGEAGIGKSALLAYAADQSGDLKVLRSTGIEFEAEFPYAGLHMLLRPVIDRIDRLPRPQGDALRGALGLDAVAGRAPADRFLVGLSVLTLLADLAEDHPVVCLIDDAHWLDHSSAEVLLFVARRLEAESVAIIFAVRELHAPDFPAPGLPELRVSRLDDVAATGMLAESAADLPDYVRDHIRDQSSGNPLALRELAAAQREGSLTADPLGVVLLPTYSRIQRTFADRIAVLPAATQTLLLLAAADNSCRAATVLAAAKRFNVSLADLAPAEQRDLVRVEAGYLCIRHPLIRAAAYHSASADERITAHRALAEILDPEADPVRRAWHLAAATTGTDESVAADLARGAEHARD
ncbi:MAG: AAA family ATPase, partial [Stackebrandtia sp.]